MKRMMYNVHFVTPDGKGVKPEIENSESMLPREGEDVVVRPEGRGTTVFYTVARVIHYYVVSAGRQVHHVIIVLGEAPRMFPLQVLTYMKENKIR